MKTLPIAALALASAFLSGCASVSVRDVQRGSGAVQRPATIYVADFETAGGNWNITSRSKSDAEFQRIMVDALADTITANLNAYVGPAQRIGKASNAPAGSWLVTGRFIRVNEGSPAGRIIIGMGVGGSKVETETLVIDSGDRRPFLRFATTGGSNAMPGMIMSSGPAGAVSNAVQQMTRGVRDDVKRTGRMITGSIAEYMLQRGWITEARLRAKSPGQFQILQPQGPRQKSRASAAGA